MKLILSALVLSHLLVANNSHGYNSSNHSYHTGNRKDNINTNISINTNSTPPSNFSNPVVPSTCGGIGFIFGMAAIQWLNSSDFPSPDNTIVQDKNYND